MVIREKWERKREREIVVKVDGCISGIYYVNGTRTRGYVEKFHKANSNTHTKDM